MIKLQWIASIWRQNDQKCWVTSQNIQNNAKLQNWSNYNELHRFDVKTIKTMLNYKRDQITMNLHQFDIRTIKNVEARRKTFKPTQNYKSDLISMNLHRFDVRTIKTTQNYESDQIIMHCIDLTSKRYKKLSYFPKLQKWSNYNQLHWFDVKTFKTFELGRKTTKVIKLQWSASIWHQNNQKCRVTS